MSLRVVAFNRQTWSQNLQAVKREPSRRGGTHCVHRWAWNCRPGARPAHAAPTCSHHNHCATSYSRRTQLEKRTRFRQCEAVANSWAGPGCSTGRPKTRRQKQGSRQCSARKTGCLREGSTVCLLPCSAAGAFWRSWACSLAATATLLASSAREDEVRRFSASPNRSCRNHA